QAFVIELLRATQVLVTNGRGFNLATPDHLRFVTLPEVPVLTEAIGRIGDFLGEVRAGLHAEARADLLADLRAGQTMAIRILAIGKKHEDWVSDGINRYERRLRKPFGVSWQLLPHSSREGNAAREEESE